MREGKDAYSNEPRRKLNPGKTNEAEQKTTGYLFVAVDKVFELFNRQIHRKAFLPERTWGGGLNHEVEDSG